MTAPITADARSLAPAVTRAAAILDLLAQPGGRSRRAGGQQADDRSGESLGVSAIARALGLPKSSVANICAALVEAGLLRSAGGGFALGPRLPQLGAAYLEGVDHVALFHQCCDRLGSGRRETTQLATLGDALDVVYLARRDGAAPVRLASAPGRMLPATCTATGKAMLAGLAPAELDRRLAGATVLPRLTAHSIISVPAVRAELDTTRRRGHAVDHQEVIEGVVCLGVAIAPATAADPWLAVSFTLLEAWADAAERDRLAEELHALAAAIAVGLGAAPVAPAAVSETRPTASTASAAG